MSLLGKGSLSLEVVFREARKRLQGCEMRAAARLPEGVDLPERMHGSLVMFAGCTNFFLKFCGVEVGLWR